MGQVLDAPAPARGKRPAFTASEWLEFDTQRQRVAGQFRGLGRGAQQRASFALHLHPSVVSQVIRGFSLDKGILNRLEEWAANEATVRAEAS